MSVLALQINDKSIISRYRDTVSHEIQDFAEQTEKQNCNIYMLP
jgi:hypothetical protein